MSTATTLTWSDELVLGDPRTDVTHQEFIDLLNATADSDAAQKLPKYQTLVEHTMEHFAQEERWMQACGVQSDFCHFSQHSSVLEVMKEVERRALAGETALIGQMLEALVEWFPMHASSMDAGLVTFLREKGFDTATESFKAGSSAVSTPDAQSLGCGA
jgi:hemerythrin-like metal-binding protein